MVNIFNNISMSEDAWEVLNRMGEDAIDGKLDNPSVNHDYYLYSKSKKLNFQEKDKLKILPLTQTLKLDSKLNRKDYKDAPVIFKKENLYLNQKFCWFEVLNIDQEWSAFYYDKETFLQDLYSIGIWNSYNQRQINALKYCRKEKVSTKKQDEIIFLWEFYLYYKNLRRTLKKYKYANNSY